MALGRLRERNLVWASVNERCVGHGPRSKISQVSVLERRARTCAKLLDGWSVDQVKLRSVSLDKSPGAAETLSALRVRAGFRAILAFPLHLVYQRLLNESVRHRPFGHQTALLNRHGLGRCPRRLPSICVLEVQSRGTMRRQRDACTHYEVLIDCGSIDPMSRTICGFNHRRQYVICIVLRRSWNA